MNKKITENTYYILRKYSKSRDNDGILALHYADIFNSFISYGDFILCNIQPKLTRIRAILQNKYPELRGKKWTERQKHSKRIKEKIRQIEKPENLEKIYNLTQKKGK